MASSAPISFFLSSLLLLFFSLFSLVLSGRLENTSRNQPHSYFNDDVPHTWPIGELEPVLMSVENTQRYALDTPSGIKDWTALMPPGEGIIHIGLDHQPLTISLFHQLQCLEIIRASIVARATDPAHEGPGGQERHCLNYIREMVLCRSDLRLENVRSTGPHAVQPTSTHICRDWEAVYQEAAKNQEEWKEWAPELV